MYQDLKWTRYIHFFDRLSVEIIFLCYWLIFLQWNIDHTTWEVQLVQIIFKQKCPPYCIDPKKHYATFLQFSCSFNQLANKEQILVKIANMRLDTRWPLCTKRLDLEKAIWKLAGWVFIRRFVEDFWGLEWDRLCLASLPCFIHYIRTKHIQ